MLYVESNFEWDFGKEAINVQKHGINFKLAAKVFKDPRIVISIDDKHSSSEDRLFGVGFVGGRIMTVRFVYRGKKIRILGAGYWRKGVRLYEKENIR